MKILHLNDHLSFKGGVEVYLRSLLSDLEARGHEAVVAYAQGDSDAWPASHLLPLLSSPLTRDFPRAENEMGRLLDRLSPDVVHIHSVYNAGAIAACLKRCPTVLHLHDYRYLCPASSFYRRRSQSICQRTVSPSCFAIGPVCGCQTPRPRTAWGFYSRVRFVAREAHQFRAVLANSEYVAERFRAMTGPLDSLSVLHYFCPIDVAPEPNTDPSNRVLFLGRARESKGIREFVQTIGALDCDVAGVIVGDPSPEIRELIARTARENGCADRITCTGWMDREAVETLLNEAAVVVFPSLWAEPFGIVGLEAMARGVPVVAFDVGGVRDWLEEGVTGFLVELGKTDQMAARVQTLLENRELRETMGQAAQRVVLSRFQRGVHLDKLLQIYQGEG